MSGDQQTSILSQEAALDDYLDDLLTPEDAPVPTITPVKTGVVRHLDEVRKKDDIPVVQPAVIQPVEIAQTRMKTEPEPQSVHVDFTAPDPVPASAQQPTITATVEQIEAAGRPGKASAPESQPDPAKPVAAALSGIVPGWADHAFQCTQIVVDGIPLAFPTHAIRAVVDFDANLRSVGGQPEWVMGLMMQANGFIAVIDSARLFYQDAATRSTKPDYKKVVSFGDGRWGLACDNVGEVLTILSQDVRWRTDNTRRKWLAGMLRHCALIDPEQLFDGV